MSAFFGTNKKPALGKRVKSETRLTDMYDFIIVDQDRFFQHKPETLCNKVPCYYQAVPKTHETYQQHINRSHSNSKQSFNNWAWKYKGILQMQHEHAKPNYYATIKLSKPITLEQYSQFTSLLASKIPTKHKAQIACFWVCHVEVNNCFHLHLHIRTTLPDAKTILESTIAKVNQKVFGKQIATLNYWEAVESIEGSSAYSVKHNQDELLFKSKCKIRRCGSFGKYFHQSPKKLFKAFCKAECERKNAIFLDSHPELLAEIQSNAEVAYGFTDHTYDQVFQGIVTAFRRSYRQDQIDKTIENATETQKDEAKAVSGILGLDYQNVLVNVVNCQDQVYVGFETLGWSPYDTITIYPNLNKISPTPSHPSDTPNQDSPYDTITIYLNLNKIPSRTAIHDTS